jgi:pyruvate/2-oxoglutarate dehydrogenase complex dihydrolipoamide acyltransferase (E2) component
MRTQHTHSSATPLTTAHPSVFGRLLPPALLLCLLAIAQQPSAPPATPSVPPQSAQQTVKPGNSLDDDPAFKRLSPAVQEWVRQVMERLNKAVADKDQDAIDQIERDVEKHQQANAVIAPAPLEKKTASPVSAPAPNAQPAQSGCDASAVKKTALPYSPRGAGRHQQTSAHAQR